ncbi:MAG: hypothetical protein H7832_09915 [Magnetococcus sp. DMHC-6]
MKGIEEFSDRQKLSAFRIHWLERVQNFPPDMRSYAVSQVKKIIHSDKLKRELVAMLSTIGPNTIET